MIPVTIGNARSRSERGRLLLSVRMSVIHEELARQYDALVEQAELRPLFPDQALRVSAIRLRIAANRARALPVNPDGFTEGHGAAPRAELVHHLNLAVQR